MCNINKEILFCQWGHRDRDMSSKIQITYAKINLIILREPLEMQTIQPKKYLK